MVVVSDAGPLCYLILIEAVHVLPVLFGRVVAPAAVQSELSHPGAPAVVQQFASRPPPWITIATPANRDVPSFSLGAGEQQAIALAVELRANLLLCDDAQARRHAAASGLRVIGTLGILRDAAVARLLNIEQAIERLRQNTNFRCTPSLYRVVVAAVQQALRD